MYEDRLHAGCVLAAELSKVFPQVNAPYCLLAVPRGGVVVAKPIAEKFKLNMELLIVRKIRHPREPEVAIGAVMPDKKTILDDNLIRAQAISPEYVQQEVNDQQFEIKRRLNAYTGSNHPVSVHNKTVFIVDDGIATGYTMQAALQWLISQNPTALVVLVPVAPAEVMKEMRKKVSLVICPSMPEPFFAVGMYYKNFQETTDDEVRQILRQNND